MNLMSGNIVASQRDILGLPVCDLDWAEAFAFAEQVATMPFGQSVIAFINAGNASLMMRDPEYRAVLERQVVLPDGLGVDIASMLFHGHKFPANLTGTDFVPALFTYISRPMRVAMIGARHATLMRAAENFRRHTPWHDFLPISDGFFDQARSDEILERVREAEVDILLVAMSSPAQEKWIDRHVGPGHARLVVSVETLFDVVAGGMRPASQGIRQRRADLSFLYHVLRYKLSGMGGVRDTAKAG